MSDAEIMRIAVMGAGGVGGYFGARLALAGNDVTFVARGRASGGAARARAARSRARSGDARSRTSRPPTIPRSLAPVDVVMFCVKLWDVGERGGADRAAASRTAAWSSRSRTASTRPSVLQRVLGAERVARRRRVHRGDDSRAGRHRAHRHDGAAARRRVFDAATRCGRWRFAAACSGAGIDAELSADIRRALWEKFCFLAAMSALHVRSRGSRSAWSAAIPTCARRSRRRCARPGRVGRARGVALRRRLRRAAAGVRSMRCPPR